MQLDYTTANKWVLGNLGEKIETVLPLATRKVRTSRLLMTLWFKPVLRRGLPVYCMLATP